MATRRDRLFALSGVTPLRDVLPIFIAPLPLGTAFRSFMGTGFRVTHDLLVTCWHCVASDLAPDEVYVVLGRDDNDSPAAYTLADVERDRNGYDLATARVEDIDFPQTLNLELAEDEAPAGSDVWAFGYPLTDREALPSGELRWELHPRYLQGYITRSFHYKHPNHPKKVPSYELDMRAPEGLSGAPVIAYPTFTDPTRRRQVVGVVYGRHAAEAIEEWASVDRETGERRPEVQRLEHFALAHYTDTLRDLTGAATGGLRLADYIAQAQAQ
jgi:hypothetical protein